MHFGITQGSDSAAASVRYFGTFDGETWKAGMWVSHTDTL